MKYYDINIFIVAGMLLSMNAYCDVAGDSVSSTSPATTFNKSNYFESLQGDGGMPCASKMVKWGGQCAGYLNSKPSGMFYIANNKITGFIGSYNAKCENGTWQPTQNNCFLVSAKEGADSVDSNFIAANPETVVSGKSLVNADSVNKIYFRTIKEERNASNTCPSKDIKWSNNLCEGRLDDSYTGMTQTALNTRQQTAGSVLATCNAGNWEITSQQCNPINNYSADLASASPCPPGSTPEIIYGTFKYYSFLQILNNEKMVFRCI